MRDPTRRSPARSGQGEQVSEIATASESTKKLPGSTRKGSERPGGGNDDGQRTERDHGSKEADSLERVHAGGLDTGTESHGAQRPDEASKGRGDLVWPGGLREEERTALYAFQLRAEKRLEGRESATRNRPGVVGPESSTGMRDPSESLSRGSRGNGPGTDRVQKGIEGIGNGVGQRAADTGIDWSVEVSRDQVRAVVDAKGDLETFILGAVERNNFHHGVASEDEDRDGGSGHRCSVWWFASELKGYPGLCELPVSEVVRIVDGVLASHGGWQILPDCDVWGREADPREDFIDVWHVINKPLDFAFDPGAAAPLAERFPLSSSCWSSPTDESFRRAVALCFWYAHLLDADGRFFLSTRKLGSILGVSHLTAAKYLRLASREGLLEQLEPPTNTKATRYRFRFEAVACTTEAQAHAVDAAGRRQ